MARVGTMVSAVMFAGNAAAALPLGDAASALVISPSAGDSRTEISMQIVPGDRRCPGDGARWTTFLVPVGLEPDVLRYDDEGPLGGTVTSPVLSLTASSTGEPLTPRRTGPDGEFDPAPLISFERLGPGAIPDGRYRMGFACVRPEPRTGTYVTDRSWTLEIRVAHDEAGGPATFRWTVGDDPRDTAGGASPTFLEPPSASASAADRVEAVDTGGAVVVGDGGGVAQDVFVVVPGPTSTSTTTTVPASTSTLVVGVGTVSTVVAAGGPLPIAAPGAGTGPPAGTGAGGTGAGGVGSSAAGAGGAPGPANRFPRTGSEIRDLLLWGLALMTFGRLAVVAGRRADRGSAHDGPRATG